VVDLNSLVRELRANAGEDDTAYAQRVALVCAHIADQVAGPAVTAGDAIRTFFKLEGGAHAGLAG